VSFPAYPGNLRKLTACFPSNQYLKVWNSKINYIESIYLWHSPITIHYPHISSLIYHFYSLILAYTLLHPLTHIYSHLLTFTHIYSLLLTFTHFYSLSLINTHFYSPILTLTRLTYLPFSSPILAYRPNKILNPSLPTPSSFTLPYHRLDYSSAMLGLLQKIFRNP